MAERSFAREVRALRLGAGEVFQGEGILAVAKALLQSGVSYVGGYQGAPVSHLMDVFADARPILDELGVHFENCASEAGAAAMLGASINYPLRGAATWKSVVGTNVASDALSNLASAGVTGGALIIVGEDYGEGSSIIQERSHAFAMKSQIWLLDPRPDLPSIVRAVEQGFALSEASRTPVMLELRIRACHVHGSFVCKDNRAPALSRNRLIERPDFDYGRICLPPSTYAQEQDKLRRRWPAALDFIRGQGLNESFAGDPAVDVGIILQGGLYNGVVRALALLGLADARGRGPLPLHVLNVTYPLVPEEIAGFCAGKKAVLVVEEGQPDFLEQAINTILRRAGVDTRLAGKDLLPAAGEYTGGVLLDGIAAFLADTAAAGIDHAGCRDRAAAMTTGAARARALLTDPLPARPPGFCTGCPERPVFSAMKLLERETGPLHVAADIGCHTFSTLPPFNIGNTVLGYGLGLASASGLAPAMDQRLISIMGDGGLWHNGLTSGVANAVFNRDDGVLLVMNNGFTAATGGQEIPSSTATVPGRTGTAATGGQNIPSSTAAVPGRGTGQDIERALRGVGVGWLRRVRSYSVGRMVETLRAALDGGEDGLRVIVADGECQLARQRRLRPRLKEDLAAGQPVVRTRFGVDPDLCTGDHSCIRLSGCPSLTIRPNPDPLKTDPVAHVDNSCVGCGLCGEVSHAAVLCPSFHEVRIVANPGPGDRLWAGLGNLVRRLFGRRRSVRAAT